MIFRRWIALLLALAAPAWALPPSNTSSIATGSPRAAAAQLRAAQGTVPVTRVRLPSPPSALLEKVREANDAPGPKRLQLGVGRALESQAEARGERLQWHRHADGWVGHWEVTSEGAASLRIALQLEGLPEGAEVRFADAGEATVYGPVPLAELLAQSPYWSPVIEGDMASIEVFVPARANPAQARVHLVELAHLYVSLASGKFGTLFNISGSCQEDLVCRANSDPASVSAGKAVAGMVFMIGGTPYSCTGTLLNPTGTQIPYFYSAAHCISTQTVASTLTTHWFFDRAFCGTGNTGSGYVQVTGGADLLYANSDSDALFMRLRSAPPAGAVYAGWDSAPLSSGTALVGIHHPGGDWKKISRGNTTGFFTGLDDFDPDYPGGSFVKMSWTNGVTEPGSSGSGLFSLSGGVYRLRGGLWGGASSCQDPAQTDYYSRFDQVFPAIARWLDPPPAPEPCTYNLSRTGISVSAAAESGTVTVTPSPSSCTWRASSGTAWVTLTGTGTGATAATGTGTFTYNISANNSTAARNGIITVAGTSVPVLQSSATLPPPDPSCAYTLSPSIRSIGAAKHTGVVTVTTTAGCTWTAVSDVEWLQANGSGSSSGSFTYSVQANTSTSTRTATVTVGNKTFTLLQGAPGSNPPVPPGTPAMGLSTTSLDMGGVSMGTTSGVREIVVTNTGGGALNVGLIARSGGAGHSTNCITLLAGESCSINATITAPASAGALNATNPIAGTLTINSDAPGSPHAVALTATAEKSLVTHFYRAILRREADAGGKIYWQDESVRLAGKGANLNETWFALATAFFFSPEYAALGRSNTGFVTDLYNTFFNRLPDTGGLDYWTGLLVQGMPRDVVLVSFMISPEFTNFATAIFGNTAARAEVDTVGDFYRGILSRLPDSGGFDYWVGRFRAAQCSGPASVYAEVESISSGFVGSSEYSARNRSNSQFVGDMYNAFLRRGGDLAGVQYWISQLDSGARTRENVRRAFISTPEFAARVQAVIAQGCAG